MKHIKIHKHHFWTLIFSCLLFIWVTIHQTVAGNIYSSMKNTYSQEVKIIDMSEEELELNSAPKYSKEITEKKVIFKEKLNKVLAKKLDEFPNEKLEKVSERINTALEQVENNEKMKQDKKEKIISQLLALLEIIEEKIEYNEDFSLEIDLEELFSV